eukprot:1139872-Pelagomonas_calceolata.AAC.1
MQLSSLLFMHTSMYTVVSLMHRDPQVCMCRSCTACIFSPGHSRVHSHSLSISALILMRVRVQELYRMHSLPPKSQLLVHLQAGLSALKMPPTNIEGNSQRWATPPPKSRCFLNAPCIGCPENGALNLAGKMWLSKPRACIPGVGTLAISTVA